MKKNVAKHPAKKAAVKRLPSAEVVEEFRMVPIDYSDAANALPTFANMFVVQHDSTEFHLLFFQNNPPLILGEDAGKKLKGIEKITPKCVARIVVTTDRLHAIVRALQENLGKQSAHAPIIAKAIADTNNRVDE